MTFSSILAICGMILGVLGAVILARSFVLKHPREVFHDINSLGNWDFQVTRGARNLLLSWLVQAIEARVGAIILGIGFLLQALSQIIPQEHVHYLIAAIVIIMFIVITSISFFWLQNSFIRKAACQALTYYNELELGDNNEDWKREIPVRQQELRNIHKNPSIWLRQPEGSAGSKPGNS